MKRRYVNLALLFSAIFLLGLQDAEACSCVIRQTCEFASGAQTVFVGKILDTTEITRKVKHRELPSGGDWEENEYLEKRQISRISIEESFFGTNGKTEVLIETEIGSSCAFPLQKGVSYLIYANQSQNEENLMTGFCSGTKLASAASQDLAYLRDTIDSKATVEGKIGFGEFGNLNPSLLLKYGVTTVRLTDANKQLETQIAENGSYKFTNVRSGIYKIQVILPDSLTTEDEYNPDIARELEIADTNKITVKERGCLRKDFIVQENGRISGRITDSKGDPIGDVTVYLIPVTANGQKIPQEDECYDTGLCLDSQENGRFFFKGIKAGKYLVGVRLGGYVCNDCDDAKYLKAFYPGVPAEKNATPVTVKFGEPTDDINFKLTATYKEREVAGRVTFMDGRPAPLISVRYLARTPDFKDNAITFIKTDNAGNFSFSGYENHVYLVGAFTDRRDGSERFEALAVDIKVDPNKPVKGIKLVLDQDGNNGCTKCFDSFGFPKNRPVIFRKSHKLSKKS